MNRKVMRLIAVREDLAIGQELQIGGNHLLKEAFKGLKIKMVLKRLLSHFFIETL